MNEIDQSHEGQLSVVELLHPKRCPEIAFQSYNKLSNNALQQRDPFLSGSEGRNPHLNYPDLSEMSSMDKGIIKLGSLISQLDGRMAGVAHSEVINSTVEYRMAEMEYIKVLGQLDYVLHDVGDEIEARELARRAQDLSETLYGKADPEIRDAALNTIWAIIDTKNFSGKARLLYDDLVYGFTSGEGYEISPLQRSSNPEAGFPDKEEAIAWASEHFEENNSDIKALVDAYWDQKVADNGPGYVCTPEDIIDCFNDVIAMRDPTGLSGVKALPGEGKTALSWESSLMAIVVGTNREPIRSREVLFTRIMHEYGNHGQKVVNGLKTDLPVLATGMYTNTPDPDYLTFEEGYATLMESAMQGEKQEWRSGGMDYYLAVAFAASGDDFRAVFEKMWRYNLLSDVKIISDVSEEDIAKARRSAYTKCIRVFRGNPVDCGNRLGVVPTYNKDLAYLAGKVKAARYVEEAYKHSNPAYLDFALLGKFDPTNPVQYGLALEAFERAGIFSKEQLENQSNG